MATPSRPSTASARLRNKTSELSDLFRGRQHASLPSSSSTDPSPKAKRKLPLFSLRKKSPAASDPLQHSPAPPVPTPRSSTNPTSPIASTYRQAHPPQLTIPRSSFSPLPAFDDASSSKRSSTSPINSRSTRSFTRTPSSNSPSTVSKSRTPTPTSAVTLGGGSFSDSEPPRSNTRTPTAVLRSYASDDEERRYLSARNLPPGKPAPTKSLPPTPANTSYPTAYPTPITPTTPSISFPSPASSYTPLPPDAKLPPSSVRKFAVSTSTARSPSFKLTSGSESASESAQGYTSASGSESTTGLGLGFRIRTRSGQGIGTNNGSTSRAASVRVGVLRASNAVAGSKATSPPSPISQCPPVSLARTSPPTSRTSLERMGSSRPVQPSQSLSVKRASPPIQAISKSPAEVLPRRQTEPTIAPSSTKHASWLVIPKPAHTSANSSGPSGGHESKVTAPSKLRARAASDSRTFTAANSVSPVGSTLQASTSSGASAQSITATQALTAPSPLNLLKSPSTVVAPTSSQTNRVESRTNSPPPTEPLPSPPRPNLSRTSSDTSRQASALSSGSPSSSESSTRTLTIPPIPSSTSHTVSASGTDSSTTLSSPSVSITASTVRSLPPLPSASGNTRRPKDERTTGKDKSKDSTWPARSASKRSSPPGSSLPVQSHISSDSPPYASPSSFSASTTALSIPSISTSSPQPPPSRVIVPIPPTPANLFALQTENADLRAEIASMREQLENADRLARRREQEIRGLRWLVINWGGDKKDTLGFTSTTERRPSGDNAESQEEVQAAVRYLRAESESGYGSGSASASHSRLSHSSTYSSVYPAESVSDGSNSEVGTAQRFGPGPSARASEDHALDAIPERTVMGGEDTAAAEAERRRKRDERRASRALKRLSSSTISDAATGSGLDEVVSQGMLTNNVAHGRTMSIDQVMEGDRARRERIGLKGMDEVLDKLRAVAGVDSGVGAGVKK